MAEPRRTRRRELAVARAATLPASPAVAWGVLADTNRWDRIVGWTPTTYTYAVPDPARPHTRVPVGHARFVGIPIHFLERGEYWAGSHLRGERRFVGAFAYVWRHAFLEVRVEPAAGGEATAARLRVGIAPAGILGWLTVPVVMVRFWLLLGAYLRAAERALARGAAALPAAATPASEPAPAQARRALIASGAERLLTSAVHRRSPAALRARVGRFADAPVAERIRRRIVEHVAGQPDEAVVQMAPFDVARAWGEDRREVLRGFLHATRAGLVDLEWQVDCPTCRVGAATAARLDALGRRIHCEECDISFDVDFAEHVHATFTASPAIRPIERVTYCAGSPYYRPHVHASIALAAGEERTLAPLPDDDLLVRAWGTDHAVRLSAAEARAGVALRVGPDGIAVERSLAGPAALAIRNDGGGRTQIVVERTGWSADIARGSLLVTLPDFVELFGTEAPAAGHPLSVGALAVLFTDVVASTELYLRLGDARAYALIQAHWDRCQRIAAERGGAVIKTLGDGVMASFPDLAAAVDAALAMMAHADELSQDGIAFALRAGAHEGPCFVVRANDRLDLFGLAVHTAARLSAAAGGHQLAMLASALESPGVVDRLEASGCLVHRQRAALRGLPGEHDVALASRADAAVSVTGEHPPVVVAADH